MRKVDRLPFFFLLAFLATGLCACPPLQHKIYIRNNTPDTAHLILICDHSLDTISQRNISVRAKGEIVPINKNTRNLLTESLSASYNDNQITLAIPPRTTVFANDIINSFHRFADKALIIQHGGKIDSMHANYPYKDLKNVKRKRDAAYNYFYRTIVYYDIR